MIDSRYHWLSPYYYIALVALSKMQLLNAFRAYSS